MDSSRDLDRIIEAFHRSNARFLRVVSGTDEIVLSKDGGEESPGIRDRLSGRIGDGPTPAIAQGGGAPRAHEDEKNHHSSDSFPTPRGPLDDVAGENLILSTAIGIFYRRPKPDAQPYVEVGDTVSIDQTVGLVEAMKVFMSVASNKSGVVEEILVADADFVEVGTPLLRLRGR